MSNRLLLALATISALHAQPVVAPTPDQPYTARGENAGVAFFVDRVPSQARRIIDAVAALLVLVIAAYVAFHAVELGLITTGQTTGSGLPLELTFYPMGAGATCMAVFAFYQFVRRGARDIVIASGIVGALLALWISWNALAPDTVAGAGPLMLIGFVFSLAGGMAIGFAAVGALACHPKVDDFSHAQAQWLRYARGASGDPRCSAESGSIAPIRWQGLPPRYCGVRIRTGRTPQSIYWLCFSRGSCKPMNSGGNPLRSVRSASDWNAAAVMVFQASLQILLSVTLPTC